MSGADLDDPHLTFVFNCKQIYNVNTQLTVYQYSQAYDVIPSTVCQYSTSIIPSIHNILIQNSGQPNDNKDHWRN